jgi:two-component system sensor histidine kinase PilS (NtrC family)
LLDLGFQRAGERWEQVLTRGDDGEPRTLGLSRTSLKGLEGEPVGEVVTFQDLTELRRAEEALRQRERLATLGRFAAKIAHEIRNPLASISSAAELLSEGVQEEDRALTEIVQREVDRLNSLLRQVLDFSKAQPLARQPIALGALAEEAASAFRLQLKPGARLSLAVEGAPVCLADPQALHQVLWNLWRNAAEASEGVAGAEVKTRIWAADGSAWVEVSDAGPGIAPAQRAHLFEPFWTTKRGGTGLGLTTTHQLVTDLGGDITLAPWVAGQGACFTVCLPLADTAQRAPSAAGDAGASAPALASAATSGEGVPLMMHPRAPLLSLSSRSPRSPLPSLRAKHHAEAP